MIFGAKFVFTKTFLQLRKSYDKIEMFNQISDVWRKIFRMFGGIFFRRLAFRTTAVSRYNAAESCRYGISKTPSKKREYWVKKEAQVQR